MRRRCSNCIHSQFEGYCGQMAVCDSWEQRTTYAEMLPSKHQLDDEARLNRVLASKKPSRRKPKRPRSAKKKSSPMQFKDEASRIKHESYLRENEQIALFFESRMPIHAFPREGCTKEQILREVREWCRDHDQPYDTRYEGEPKEKLISRFLSNEKDPTGRKTGNYRPDPVKVIRSFAKKQGKR